MATRRVRTAGVAAAALTALVGVRAAAADSLVDDLGPREVAVGDSLRAGAVGSLATTLNPAGLPLSSELVFEGSYGYRPTDGASVVGVSACDSTNAAPGCFFYHYVTASPAVGDVELERRAHTFGLTLSRAISPRVIFGVAGKYFDYNSELTGEGDSSGFNFDAGLTFRVTDIVNLAATGHNIYGDESPQFPRAVAGGLMARVLPQLTVSFDGVWNLDRPDGAATGRYGGGLEYFFSSSSGQVGYPIRAGALHDVSGSGTFVTGGLGLATLKLGVDIGGRVQVDGGDEKMIIGSVRFYGPRQEAGAL